MPPLLTIASVIKPPAAGFDKTVASVQREFGGAADLEFLIKVKCSPNLSGSDFGPNQSGSLSLSLSGLGPHQSSAAHCAAKAGPRPDSDPDSDSDYLSGYAGNFGRIIESPDSGVFDGMNQALEAAAGEWILFLNAGDWLEPGFANAFRAAVAAHPDAEFLCFDGHTVDATDGRAFLRKVPERLSFSSFLKRVPVLHAGLIVRTSLMRQLRFDDSLDLAADFALLTHLVATNRPWARVPFTGASMVSGGLSEQFRIRARWQATRALWRNFPSPIQRIMATFAFLRYITLHLIIVHIIRRIPPLRRLLINRQK